MPYGNGSNKPNSARVRLKTGYPGGSSTSSSEQVFHGFGTDYFNRAGRNAKMATASTCRRYTGPMKIVPVTLYRGPRLPYKVFNKKIGKPVWARKPITVYKLVPDKSQVVYAKGLDLPPNPFTYYSKFVQPTINTKSLRGVYSFDKSWFAEIEGDLWSQFTAPYGSGPIPSSPDDSDALHPNLENLVYERNQKAVQKLYSKVKNQNVNLLNALGERAQTIKLLRDLVKRLVKALLALKRFNLLGAAMALLPNISNSTSISNEILLIQYGVRPLIDDINGLIDHLNKWEQLQFDVKVSSTGVLEPFHESTEFYNGVRATCKKTTLGKCTVTYKARLRVKDNFNRNLTRLGLTNLNATAWELIPFSFLVDWIIPIGEYLNTTDAFDDLEIVYCSKTVFYKENVIFDRQFGGRDSWGYNWGYGASQCVIQKVKVTRELLTTPPQLLFPALKSPFSQEHFLNFMALINSLRR